MLIPTPRFPPVVQFVLRPNPSMENLGMRYDDEISDFRSAIECPASRPICEEATSELRPLSLGVFAAIESLAIACEIGPECESHIEVEFGVRLTKVFRLINDPTLSLKSQFTLGRYRYDFGIIREGRSKPIALIECDGKEFHQTQAQIENDHAKDRLAEQCGIHLFRFSGSAIYRDAQGCVLSVLRHMRYGGHLTQAQWAATE